ncbi:MAG TPA: hypothetical protein VLK84_06030, partial [Longimicrobium sp.]|nr:hypothetical protein [Longimicrobium sp.]
MLGIIIEAFKSIIDLLHKKDENKKVRVETALAERELAQQESLLVRATNADIVKYDPTVKYLVQTYHCLDGDLIGRRVGAPVSRARRKMADCLRDGYTIIEWNLLDLTKRGVLRRLRTRRVE